MSEFDLALSVIKGMKGTILVFALDKEIIEILSKVENSIKSQIGLDVKNEGLNQCLTRDHVICIVKDVTFRPPPEPTVVMMGDDDLVCGIEVLPGQHAKFNEMDNIFWLSSDFIVYTDRIPRSKEYFLMPPVSFPEVQCLEGIKDVVSCSPSPLGDLMIKNKYGLEDNPKLASILVGFNVDH